MASWRALGLADELLMQPSIQQHSIVSFSTEGQINWKLNSVGKNNNKELLFWPAGTACVHGSSQRARSAVFEMVH